MMLPPRMWRIPIVLGGTGLPVCMSTMRMSPMGMARPTASGLGQSHVNPLTYTLKIVGATDGDVQTGSFGHAPAMVTAVSTEYFWSHMKALGKWALTSDDKRSGGAAPP